MAGAIALRDRIERGEALVGVVGLGYVGLSLARAFVEGGLPVLGFDTDAAKVAALGRGESPHRHVPASDVARMLRAGLHVTERPERLGEPDALLICVPTPLTAAGEPDLSCVVAAATAAAARLRPGQLIVLESTTYPGTTRRVVLPILQRAGLKLGEDYWLAYSPEREDPGNPTYTVANIPKVVAGADPRGHELAVALYRRAVAEVVGVSSCEVAEACKLLENTYRAVNIALANELRGAFAAMGVDVWEVIEAAKTKPFGFQAFYPGPGVGGHCIPINPHYLAWKARDSGAAVPLVDLACAVNDHVPLEVAARVEDALTARGRSVAGARVLLLGVAYKRDSDDAREAPGPRLLRLLLDRGAVASYNDPHVPRVALPPDGATRLDSQPLSEALLVAQDCVVVVTDHSAYDWAWVVRHARLVIDTRNATRGAPCPGEHIVGM